MVTKKQPATRAAAPAKPKLAKGEVYAGITLYNDALHHLILRPGSSRATWKDATAWAKKAGGVLPSRHDGLVLLKNVPGKFERTYYWLDEQLAAGPAYAWGQSFGWGSQGYWTVDFKFRVRAVRRVAIR